MVWVGTTVPEPLAWVSTRIWVAVPLVTVIVPEAVTLSPPDEACILVEPRACPVNTALAPEPTRSPATIPPVTPVRDHVGFEILATKLPLASRATIVDAPFELEAVVLALANVPDVMLSALVVEVVV